MRVRNDKLSTTDGSYAEHEDKTKLTLQHSVLESVAAVTGAQQGWIEMLDWLAEDLAKA